MRRLTSCLVFLALACATSQPGPTTTRNLPPAGGARVVDRREIGGTEIPPPPVPLTEAEVRRAAAIATEALRARNLFDDRTYFVHAEMLHDKSAPLERRALVEHYRYEGDVTITSIVDLGPAARVLDVRTAEHVPTSLSNEEFEQARSLALADPRVAQAIAPARERIVIEPLPLGTTNREDRFFGHRVVRLLFRVGADYLARPIVFVDLTDRRVLVEEPSLQERM